MARHSRSNPLVDLQFMHFFRIPGTYGSEESIKVYGTIVVRDDHNDVFCEIFNHSKSNPQLVTPSVNTLNFTGPVDRVCLMYKPVVEVDLRNCADDSVILLASKPLEDPTFEYGDGCLNCFDSVHIQSELGYLILHYSSLGFGVVARIEVKLEKKPVEVGKDSPSGIVNVCGCISASSPSTYGDDHISYRTLFNRKYADSERVVLGSAVTLSRKFVAVPLYTDLVIEVASLLDHSTQKPLATKNLTFWPNNGGACFLNTKGKDSEEVYVNVCVIWYQPYLLCLSTGQEEDYKYVPDVMRMPRVAIYGMPLVEIFSAIIGVKGDKTLALCGTVCFHSRPRKYRLMFSREKKKALLLPSRMNLLPLSRPNHYVSAVDSYSVKVVLDDQVEGVKIRGLFNSPIGWRNRSPKWFDRRLCSVVRGQGAFMALHYIAFKNAITAVVEVLVFPCGSGGSSGSGVISVYGEIFASYGDHVYKTPYDMEFYRSRLFITSKNEAVQVGEELVEEGSPLLCKSTIPVSTDTSLNIEMDIHALDGSLASDSSDVNFCHKFEFPINCGEPRFEKIEKASCAVAVRVTWFSLL